MTKVGPSKRTIASVLAVTLGLTLLSPVPVQAVCVKQLAYWDGVPQYSADGGRMYWIARTLSATDWAAGGFASEVLWVGTDNDQADTSWVEVGATHGWQGQSLYVFYTARALNGGGYAEYRFLSQTPVVGQAYTFSVFRATTPGIYSAQIYSGSVTSTRSWSGHNLYTVNYSGGLEATCNNSRVDRTYVSLNNFRRNSNGLWYTPSNGTLVDSATVGGIAWCTSPKWFRYYLNSQIPINVCA
jgi:hypothetical protein